LREEGKTREEELAHLIKTPIEVRRTIAVVEGK
jgi:hypothetical protein